MISRYKFLKESRKLGLSEALLGSFYDGFEEMRDIIKVHYPDWEKLSQDNWTKLLDIEEKLQWPVLKELSSDDSDIYQDIDPTKKGEATNFRNSINSEIELRKKKQSVTETDYRSTLKFLLQQRFEFLLTIFEVDKKTNWWLVAALTGGAVIGGTIVYNKFSKEKKEEKK